MVGNRPGHPCLRPGAFDDADADGDGLCGGRQRRFSHAPVRNASRHRTEGRGAAGKPAACGAPGDIGKNCQVVGIHAARRNQRRRNRCRGKPRWFRRGGKNRHGAKGGPRARRLFGKKTRGLLRRLRPGEQSAIGRPSVDRRARSQCVWRYRRCPGFSQHCSGRFTPSGRGAAKRRADSRSAEPAGAASAPTGQTARRRNAGVSCGCGARLCRLEPARSVGKGPDAEGEIAIARQRLRGEAVAGAGKPLERRRIFSAELARLAAMQIKELLTIDAVEEAEGDLDQVIHGLAYDSRKVGAGQIFFAVPGEKSDGHDFIADAVRRGASTVVFSRAGDWPRPAASVRVRDVRRTMGLWAAHFYGRPSRTLRLVGVTGTNGKTTLSYLIESVLDAAALVPGVIGTINYRYPGHEVPSHHTTPESLDLHEMLAQMVDAGVKSVAMEVSSHALVQERVRGLEFDVGVFTNLSRDHLDYHHDMDEYFLAKSKLFTDYLRVSPKRHKSAVIFGEDPRGRELIEKARAADLNVWSYGEGRQWDVHPVRVEKDVAGLRGTIQSREQAIDFDSALIGSANLQNILGVVGVGQAMGIGAEAVARGIRRLKAVPGRLEKVANERGITILVDYAHSPNA